MATTYWTIQNTGGTLYRVKVMFEGFEPASVPLQNYDRVLSGKASLNINSAKPFFDTAVGLFKIPQTTPVNYAPLSQVKTWMTSGTATDRTVTVVDDLSVSRNMIFISEWRPQSLSIIRDSTGNHWLVPFELHEQ